MNRLFAAMAIAIGYLVAAGEASAITLVEHTWVEEGIYNSRSGGASIVTFQLDKPSTLTGAAWLEVDYDFEWPMGDDDGVRNVFIYDGANKLFERTYGGTRHAYIYYPIGHQIVDMAERSVPLPDVLLGAGSYRFEVWGNVMASPDPGSIRLTGEHVAPIPIPAALPLLGFGLGALGLFAWRRRSAV